MGNILIQTDSTKISASVSDESANKKDIRFLSHYCAHSFFLWAVANNLNDILLPQFQQAFTLTNFQAGLIQSSFYFGYFLIPIPAGILMKRFSYKAGSLDYCSMPLGRRCSGRLPRR